MVWECQERLGLLGRSNKVTLHWVPRHFGVEGNANADELGRKGDIVSSGRIRTFLWLKDAFFKEKLKRVMEPEI